jgi:hypothetical protein
MPKEKIPITTAGNSSRCGNTISMPRPLTRYFPAHPG